MDVKHFIIKMLADKKPALNGCFIGYIYPIKQAFILSYR
jgi:hypothetical protein